MNIVIRVDSSVAMGSGHLMRCLTLASQLRARDCSVSFICRDLSGSVSHLAAGQGFRVYHLPSAESNSTDMPDTPAHADGMEVGWRANAMETLQILRTAEQPIDWLVVDHYALDACWESLMRPLVKRIMVIDDIADRPHDCDLLLDQNLYQNMETRYDGLVPTYCKKLLGPAFALLRPEFTEAKKYLRKRDGNVKRILIFFGGSDASKETAKALDAIMALNRPDIAVDVVVGGANPQREQIRQQCATMPNAAFYCQVENMAELMAHADLAIGAGGSTSWERCFLGLPTITISVANNQITTTEELARQGATIYLGNSRNIARETLTTTLSEVIKDPVRLLAIGSMAFNIVGNDQTIVADTIVGPVS